MIIHLVCGARPNFMKVAPLYHRLKQEPWAVPLIVHTGQHYDAKMSDAFFDDLGLPAPHIHLGVGSGIACRADGEDHDGVRGDPARRSGPISSSSSAT